MCGCGVCAVRQKRNYSDGVIWQNKLLVGAVLVEVVEVRWVLSWQ